MSRNRPNNRIEVDLKLLQDKNAEKLLAFGKQFQNSVENLQTTLADYAQQLSGATAATGKSVSASDAGNVNLDSARTGGQAGRPHPRGKQTGEANKVHPLWGEGPDPGYNNASVAEPLPSQGGRADPKDPTFEQQFVKAQRRIGDIPVGLRQTLGFIAESGQYDPEATEQGKWMGRNAKGEPTGHLNKYAVKASDAGFMYQAVLANIRNIRQGIEGHYENMNQMTYTGQDVGRSRAGGVFGWGSEAWREGFKNKFKNQTASWFGFNPNYSTGQAAKARELVNSYGYSGDQADFMAQSLKQLEIHQRINPDVAMALADPTARYGMSDFDQLQSVLKSIPGAARAARMNLQSFQTELLSTAETVAQSTGMSQVGAASQIAAASAVTGLAPPKVGAMLQSKSQTYMAMALTGSSYAKATIGPSALGSRLKAPMMIGNQVAQSYGFKDMGDLKQAYVDLSQGKAIDPKAEAAISAIGMMQESNPDLFGGLNLKDLIYEGGRNTAEKTIAMSQLDAGIGMSNEKQAVLAQKFGGKAMRREFQQHQAEFAAKLDDDLTPAQRAAKLSAEGKKHLMEQMDQSSRTSGERAAKATIGLSKEAQKWFTIMQSGQDKSKSNRAGVDRFAKPAITVLDYGLDIASLVPGPLALPAGIAGRFIG